MKFFNNNKKTTAEKTIDLFKILKATKIWINRRNDVISENVLQKYYDFYQSTFMKIADELFSDYFTAVLKYENLTPETIGIKITLYDETLQTLLKHIKHMNAEVAHIQELLDIKVKQTESSVPENLYNLILDEMKNPEGSTSINNLLDMLEVGDEDDGEKIEEANAIFATIINFLGEFANHLENAKNNQQMLELLDDFYLYRPCIQMADSSAAYFQMTDNCIETYKPSKNKYLEAIKLIESHLDDSKFLKFIMRINNEIEAAIFSNRNSEMFLMRLTEIKNALTSALDNCLKAKNIFDANNLASIFQQKIQQLATLIATWAEIPEAEFFFWYLSLLKQDAEFSFGKIDKVDSMINSLSKTLNRVELVAANLKSNAKSISSPIQANFTPKRKREDDETNEENYKYSR